MRVLVTRPQPDAARTAAGLEARGHRTIVDPLLSVEILPATLPPRERVAALAATSANAVRVAGAMIELDALRGLPLFAVGGHTADAAREAGFRQVHDADGDAEALAQFVARSLPAGARVLHIAGEERSRELGTLLAPARIGVDVIELYRMRAAETFGPAAQALAERGLDAALHFSSRSAATFVELAKRQGLVEAARRLRHLCLSAAVAAPLVEMGARTEVAGRPREESLMDLLES